MEELDFRLLEVDEIDGENKLSIFEKYGTKAEITDFAILLGGYVSNNHFIREGDTFKQRIGAYFTKTWNGRKFAYFADIDGHIRSDFWACEINSYISGGPIYQEGFGTRPVVSYSSIIKESLNKRENALGVYEVEYGEYPQTIVDESLSNKLESLYLVNELKKTGKEYKRDINPGIYYPHFNSSKYIEYVYNGEKYIRFLGSEWKYCTLYNGYKKLSDGRDISEEKPYWIKVEPIIWLIDEERDVAVSKKLLFAGVELFNDKKYKGDFENSTMKWYLKNNFSKNIVPSKINETKLYLVNFDGEKEKYYPAYDNDDILRELYTNIELVPEDANFIKEDALKYHSKRLVSKVEYYPYASKIIEVDTLEYLNYLFELCVLGDNEEIYTLYEEEYNKRKVNEEYMERKVDEIINEQSMKLVMK